MRFRQGINHLLQYTRYRLNKVHPAINRHYDKYIHLTLDHILAHQILQTEDFFFIQIGANDGVRADKLFPIVTRHHLKGIVIEPLKDLFAQLVANYADHPMITPLNIAIDKQDGIRILYRISPDIGAVPDWCHGIASFNRDHVLSVTAKYPGIENYIIEEEVVCLSFASLIKSQKIDKIDFLQIDTEGYDYEIIKTIDFDLMPPQIIRYEDTALSRRVSINCVEYLIQKGYRVFGERHDIIACRCN